MAEGSKTASETRPIAIRWDDADLDRFKQAAAKLSAREHLDLNMTDIIRSGARRFAEEILGHNDATTEPSVSAG